MITDNSLHACNTVKSQAKSSEFLNSKENLKLLFWNLTYQHIIKYSYLKHKMLNLLSKDLTNILMLKKKLVQAIFKK